VVTESTPAESIAEELVSAGFSEAMRPNEREKQAVKRVEAAALQQREEERNKE
jgi:hypothetical protein